MKSFKNFITEEEISKSDMKRLQRAAAAKSPEQTKRILDSLESAQERASRRTRTVPSAKPSSTVDQTPINQYIRGQQEKGIRVSQELTDTAGVRAAADRGDIKPVQAGETKPSPGATNRARARGAAARQGVDISAPESKLKPRGQRLVNVTKGGPVRVIKPTQPAPAPKPETVKKSVPTLSRRGALSKQVDPILKDLRSQGASQRALQTRMSAAVDKTRAADKALADKANEILKQTRAKTPPTVKATPTPTPAPKPTAAPKPKAVELPKFTKPAPTKVAPPPQTLNKFLRPRPVADVKPKAMPSPATATQTPAPKPQFRSTTPKSTIPSDVPADVAKQMRSAGYDKPGSSTAADKARITKKIETLTPSQSATNRAVNRAVKQAVRKPQVRAIRGASTALKGLGVAGTALDARSEYLYRKNELGQSASTATAGSAARTGGGLAGGRLGAIKGAQLGGKFGPKGALIGGAIGGIAGYLGGSSLGTKAFDAVQSPKSAAKSYKQFIKGLAGNK